MSSEVKEQQEDIVSEMNETVPPAVVNADAEDDGDGVELPSSNMVDDEKVHLEKKEEEEEDDGEGEGEVEWRIDPEDGKYYSRAEFEDQYGEESSAAWKDAMGSKLSTDRPVVEDENSISEDDSWDMEDEEASDDDGGQKKEGGDD